MGLVVLAARWIIAGVFLRSGLAKTTGLAEFRAAVANYRLLPPFLVAPVAVTLPVAEIGAAVLLAAGIGQVLVAGLLALLLVAFSIAIAINLARGRVIDCGCAGSAAAPRLISWRHVATDLALAAMTTAIAMAPPPILEAWRGPAGPVTVSVQSGAALPILLAALTCLVMVPVLRRAVTVRRLVAAARNLDTDPPAAIHRGH